MYGKINILACTLTHKSCSSPKWIFKDFILTMLVREKLLGSFVLFSCIWRADPTSAVGCQMCHVSVTQLACPTPNHGLLRFLLAEVSASWLG